MKISEVIDPRVPNEATAYPWWGIVKRCGLGQNDLLAGPFFSRAAAEGQRKRRIYDYGEKSLVYCFSGHESAGFVQLYKAAKEEVAADANS